MIGVFIMYSRTNTFRAKLRRFFNPDEWMIRLLRLSIIKEHSARPGAVIIQIDGLSHDEFTRAINNREMPHLARLLKKEHYLDRVHYSGQPSCTPAVQGALFYGVKSCVPAFSFKDRKTGKIFNMFLPENAAEVEKRARRQGDPLLKHGSAYGNIFTGGAKEAHFCVSAIGWGTLLSAANPFAIVVFVLMHLRIIIQSAAQVAVEIVLAIFDSIRGFIDGKNLLDEIKYIPFRVIACVIIREITGAGAKIDIARGMPVIHMNLAGYDEQSHHRGPGSKFAHWSLKAIDSVIKSVWKAAKRSSHRDYDVFIYSDHGQEETIEYSEVHGRPVQEAINRVLKEERLRAEFKAYSGYRRADLLRNKPVKISWPGVEEKSGPGPAAMITALGPVGHIYPPKKLLMKQKQRIARRLIASARIPLVLVSAGQGKAIAWNAEGKFMLPRDAREILGKDHPFLKETARDLAELCGHKDAGEIIISGLRKKGRTITFYTEHGSHGGPGPHETAGFALFPPGAALPDKKTVDTAEIRKAVFAKLKHGDNGRLEISKVEAPPGETVKLKIMSYNIHACMGRDGLVRPERIAKVIARHDPDIVALQEVDTNNIVSQAKVIAKMLSMKFYYHSSVLLKTGLHGNAILSKFDIKLIKRGSLPSIVRTPFLEKRGVLWVEINAYGRKVQVINTHLSLFPPEGLLQAKYILGRDWLGNPACKDPVIFCGDFNALLNSRICRAVGRDLHSIHFHVPGRSHLKTFPSFFPLGLVDHIFLGKGIKAVKIETPETQLEKTASDHLPLIAEVRIEIEKSK
jgi:endonuclease/exonuclease/phosphatase family metal-dependent hydrolase